MVPQSAGSLCTRLNPIVRRRLAAREFVGRHVTSSGACEVLADAQQQFVLTNIKYPKPLEWATIHGENGVDFGGVFLNHLIEILLPGGGLLLVVEYQIDGAAFGIVFLRGL